jgi:tRNA(adenine34) deaminase
MRRAMSSAADAARDGDVPVGAVLRIGPRTFDARNEKERRPDPTAHAEILAIRSAAATLGVWRLSAATLYVTKEPCAMCAGAIVAARIGRLVYGCSDPKAGAAGSVIDVFGSAAVNFRVDVVAGVLAEETAAQLRTFFAERRHARAASAEPRPDAPEEPLSGLPGATGPGVPAPRPGAPQAPPPGAPGALRPGVL